MEKPDLRNKGWKKGTFWKDPHGNSVQRGRLRLIDLDPESRSKRILKHTIREGMSLRYGYYFPLITDEIWNEELSHIPFEEIHKSIEGEIMVTKHSLRTIIADLQVQLQGPTSPAPYKEKPSKLPRNRKGFCGSSTEKRDAISDSLSSPVRIENSQLPITVYEVIEPSKERDRKLVDNFRPRDKLPPKNPLGKGVKNTVQIMEVFMLE
jgi:hypothetical protein